MSKKDFADKEYRLEFAKSFVASVVATQLKVLRESRRLTQAQLAALAGMKQPRISAMEDVNYSRWNIKTLQRLAEALDVGLVVRFESYGKILLSSDAVTAADLVALPYGADPVFHGQLQPRENAELWAMESSSAVLAGAIVESSTAVDPVQTVGTSVASFPLRSSMPRIAGRLDAQTC